MNLRFLARQLTNVLVTTLGHINDDRVFFGMQLARRLPGPASRFVGQVLGSLPGNAARAASAWLLGEEAIAKSFVSGSPVPSLLLGEVALNLGLLDEAESIAAAVPGVSALKSRIEWTKGYIDKAIDVLPDGARRTRLLDERQSLQPQWWPEASHHVTARRACNNEEHARGQHPTVLHVLTNSLPHTRSGYAYRSHAILTTLREAGHQTAAITRPSYPVTIGRLSQGPVELVDGVEYVRDVPLRPLPTTSERLSEQANRIAAEAYKRGAQILHTTTHYVNGLATGAAASAVGLPWVYEVRGVLEETWAAAGSTPEERSARRDSQRFALMRAKEIEVASAADAVITLGETMREHLIAGGVPAETITLIPNSVSEAVVNTDVTRNPANVRRNLDLPEAGIWVGTAASIVGYEGLGDLVDAVILARGQGTDLRLLIAGDGVALPELRERAAILGENAVFTGRVSQAQAIEYQLALDAIVVPRRDEPVCRLVTPIKPIEAMGLGRPVIISDLPALSELVPCNAGVRTPAEDPQHLAHVLAELACDSSARENYGRYGREYVLATRRWKEIGRRYGQVYSQLKGAD
ncbi:glycosyltransferase family 4 protein [Brevibacterium linens]|uniref:D-inositol 3-phosphate glycosyltransferase n=1 Tax=Brevibacterium linens ATCC 9172 TaxID=1255617 RepID=A0A2H1JEL1_BRELN|nr:glycosyltransferase family 4 protein [Brevibacterium linens]KAB1947896.1 glycosyltransferase [Brevibacterium linens ATCC 9172]SMX85947.1 Glycosyltransferase involved in cell wall bisynthesis [Brevibacterium linens ATCC 9172]